MTTTAAEVHVQRRASERILQIMLTILFFGPPVAALFLATKVPLIADAGWLARDLLSTYVCPTPSKSYLLFGQPMAVCARCWGATIGLWLGYGLFRQPLSTGWLMQFLVLPWLLRLMLAALPFSLWVAEIIAWPTAPLWLLLLNGTLAGLVAGLFFCSIWPGLQPAGNRSAHAVLLTIRATP